MKTQLKKPTFISLTLGLIIPETLSFFRKKPNIYVPKKIGTYRLVKKIVKKEIFREYGIGIYEYERKKFLIKTWTGAIKDLRYYPLVYEYLVGIVMSEKLRSSSRRMKVGVPKIIEAIQAKNSLAIVFEYIDGKSLSEFPVEKQARVLTNVIRTFEKVSKTFSKEERKQFPSRIFLFYIFSLPLFAAMTTASNIKSYKVIFKAFLACIFSLRKTLINSHLSIAHRDLDPKNIIIKKNNAYIVDCGRMVFTLPDYDINYLWLEPEHKLVIDIVIKKLNKNINKFLEQYILIQFAKSYGNPREFKNFYLEELQRRYG